MNDKLFQEIAERLESNAESLAAYAFSESCGGPNTVEYEAGIDDHLDANAEQLHRALYASVLGAM